MAILSASLIMVKRAPRREERCFETEPIELRDGWAGLVLARAAGGPDSWVPPGLPGRADWQTFLNRLVTDPDSIPGYAALKVSPSVVVIRGRVAVGADSLEVICKHMRAAVRRRAGRAWRVSRERKDFDRALELLGRGLDTAHPLAVIERRRPHRAGWLINVYIPGLMDLDHVVFAHLARVEPRGLRTVKNAIIAAVVDLCIQIERVGLKYRDMKASNILLANWDGRGGPVRTVLVDLDGFRPRRFWEGQPCWQSLVRLAASLVDHSGATRSDHCRFLKAYLLQTAARPERWKSHFRLLHGRVQAYARRAKRRRLHKIDGYGGGL